MSRETVAVTSCDADSERGCFPSFQTLSLLSDRALAYVVWVLSTFVAVVYACEILRAYVHAVPLPLSSFGLLFCSFLLFLAGLFAVRSRRVLAFILILMTSLLLQFNGSFVAGFGIHAPALSSGLVVCALAFSMFPVRLAVLFCLPIVFLWSLIFTAGSFSVWLSPDSIGQPPDVNELVGLMSSLLSVAVLGAVCSSECRRALEASEKARVELQAALNLLDEQEIAKREREKFMGHVAHELRTPLAAMCNAVSLFNHPKANDAMKSRSLALVETTSANLLAFLNDALDSFKYGNQQFLVRADTFDLLALIEEVELLFATTARSKGLALWVDLSQAQHTTVNGDSMRLRQMLSNLVGNAIKFTKEGEIRIRVIEQPSEGKHLWRFEVIDTGCGITAEGQEKLFKPFSQVHNEPQLSAGGTGLGLSIVEQLAQAMGGTAGVLSQEGEGSTFWFEVRLEPLTRKVS